MISVSGSHQSSSIAALGERGDEGFEGVELIFGDDGWDGGTRRRMARRARGCERFHG
jgi:hypothetical protein